MGINDQMAAGTATSKSSCKAPAVEPLEPRLLLSADLALAADATPQLGSEQHLTAGGTAIQVPAYSVPVLADWNADGRPDLLVGEKTNNTSGKVRVYLNTGTAAAPVYAPFFYVQAPGGDLTVPAAGCLGAYPRIYDWNQDGKKDLLIGLADGTIRLYLNTGTAANPTFGGSSAIQAGPTGAKVDLDVGDRAAFDIVDWNEDGAVDLVVGALDGKIRVYLNRRTTGEPDLNSPIVVQEAGSDLQVPSGRSSVDVYDFNQDGRKDLVVGNTDAQVIFYANQGTNAAPVFGNHETLVTIAGGSRSRPYVADFNADGAPDVLVGNLDGLVRCFLGSPGVADEENIGYATVFQNVSTVSNRRAVPVVVEGTGALKSMSIYHQGGSGHVILAIYADEAGKPGARLGMTASTLINSTQGWQTIALQNDVAVASGRTIWLAWVFENDPGLRWTEGSMGRAISSATWSGGMPDRFGTSQTEVNAVYSVYATYNQQVEATVGYSTVFPNISAVANRRAQPVVAGQTGNLGSISIYHQGGTGHAILAIYSDASGLPGTLLGTTASTLINGTEGWQTIALQSPVTVSAGQTIWLAWVFENDPGMRWTAGLPGRAMSSASWSGGMPQSFGAATTTTGFYSIYATYSNSSETPSEVIVDNADAGTSSTGVWYASSRPGPYGTDSMTTTGAGSTFTFSADLTPGVAYAVYSWWTSGPLRYTTVPCEIRSGSTLLGTVIVNQTLNGSQWNLLGVYVFSGTAHVTVSADPASTASVNADAVRFVPVTPQSAEVTVDNLDAGASSVGSWYVSGGPNPWGTNSMVTWTPGETFTFTANLVPGKSYAVYAWWTESSCRYTAVPYQILSGGTMLATVAVNQTDNGGRWNLLGTYTFTGAASVVIRSAPTSAFSTNADAVRFVPVT